MQAEELLELVAKIRQFQCEFQNVEVKAAMQGTPTRLYDTLSSFSNQEGGGILVFGLDEKRDFEIVGVYSVQDLQHKVAEQCKQMEPQVRPLFSVAEVEGKFLVSAEIPEVDVSERPVFYRGAGRQRGSYVRVGESDEPMNEYEIYTYEAFRRRLRDDIREAPMAKQERLQGEVIQEYLKEVKRQRENLSSNTSEGEILELMGILTEGRPTLTGVMVIDKYPQACFPQLGITAVVVPGMQMGEIGEMGERFLDNRRLNGTIPQMLEAAVEFVRKNGRTKTIIDESGRRRDREEYPAKAVREVVLNALVHRDYSMHTEGTPITLCMYSDRLEVVNKGGLYGRISVDQLGKVRPDTRNMALMNVLELLHITENRYSGIATIRREMAEAKLPEPEFSQQRGEFKVVLYNDRNTDVKQESPQAQTEVADRTARLLEFCQTPRTRGEIIDFLGLSRYYVMNKILKPLLDSKEIRMTMPEKPKSMKQKYYRGEATAKSIRTECNGEPTQIYTQLRNSDR